MAETDNPGDREFVMDGTLHRLYGDLKIIEEEMDNALRNFKDQDTLHWHLKKIQSKLREVWPQLLVLKSATFKRS